MVRADDDLAARPLEPARRASLDRTLAPELFGGGAVGHVEGDARSRAEPFVGLERAEVVDGVDDDMTVAADAEADAGVSKGRQVGKAIAEIALGGGADAREGAGAAEEARLVLCEVRRVDGDEALGEDAAIGEELDGTKPRLDEATRRASRGCSATCMWKGRRCRGRSGVFAQEGPASLSEGRRVRSGRRGR